MPNHNPLPNIIEHTKLNWDAILVTEYQPNKNTGKLYIILKKDNERRNVYHYVTAEKTLAKVNAKRKELLHQGVKVLRTDNYMAKIRASLDNVRRYHPEYRRVNAQLNWLYNQTDMEHNERLRLIEDANKELRAVEDANRLIVLNVPHDIIAQCHAYFDLLQQYQQ